MSQELTIQSKSVQEVQFTPKQELLLKTLMPPECTADELQLFIAVCQRNKLDPFSRQIYVLKSKKDGKLSIQATVDGFRVIAERSGLYGGQTTPLFLNKNGEWSEVWIDETEYPVAAKVGIIRKDFKEPLYAIAKWSSYAPYYYDQVKKVKVLGEQWRTRPDLMLAKVAECLAIRKTFPNDLSGVYGEDEINNNDNIPTIEIPSESDDKHYKLISRMLENYQTTEQLDKAIEKITSSDKLTDEQKEELVLLCVDKKTQLTQNNELT